MGAKDLLRTEAEHCEMSIIKETTITEDGRCYQMPVQQIGKLTTPARVAPKSPHAGCKRLRPGHDG